MPGLRSQETLKRVWLNSGKFLSIATLAVWFLNVILCGLRPVWRVEVLVSLINFSQATNPNFLLSQLHTLHSYPIFKNSWKKKSQTSSDSSSFFFYLKWAERPRGGRLLKIIHPCVCVVLSLSFYPPGLHFQSLSHSLPPLIRNKTEIKIISFTRNSPLHADVYYISPGIPTVCW